MLFVQVLLLRTTYKKGQDCLLVRNNVSYYQYHA